MFHPFAKKHLINSDPYFNPNMYNLADEPSVNI